MQGIEELWWVGGLRVGGTGGNTEAAMDCFGAASCCVCSGRNKVNSTPNVAQYYEGFWTPAIAYVSR